MQQILTLWTNLDARRRITVIVASALMFGAVLLIARMASQPSMSLLYSGLENGQAGEIVRALEQRGATFEVRGNSIYVEAPMRDELRMTLASEGLPRNSSQGYELLDNLSGFGTTSQMFDAAYWRAKEGELARTIATSPMIDSARVHIAHQGSNPFQRDLRPTASVALTANGPITPAQAKALRYLVASAVAGLNPDDVAVIDDSGELIASGEETDSPSGEDRAQELKDKVRRLLEARVGHGNAVVEVSIDTVNESESIRERRFDPQNRVAISTDTEEKSESSKNAQGGDVTVASNLPNGDAGGGNGTSQSQGSESRERVNYEVSEINREVLKQPGAIRRMTVAVLVNAVAPGGAVGAAPQPRSEEELSNLRELVASAVGFDETRGDVITIKSMPFEQVADLGTASPGGLMSNLHLDVMSLLRIAVLALVALVLGLFVIKPVLTNRATVPDVPLLGGGDDGDALTGEIAEEEEDFALPELSFGAGFGGDDAGGGGFPMMGDFGDMGGSSDDDPVSKLQSLIEERKEETMEILRSWLEEDEEKEHEA